ncbi:MAG: MFS transporter [Pseudomarimonas sp.]
MSQSQFALLGQRRFLPFFVTQALGAFNDNVFKQSLIILIAFGAISLSAEDKLVWTNLAAGLFILPFFLFSALAGQWAEKFEKSNTIRLIKVFEIVIMLLAAVGFAFESLPFLMFVLFLMGTHSALFGPLKYAILPQALKPEELVGGNALVEAGTFLTILIGSMLGGWLIQGFANGTQYVSATVIVIAVLGWLSSRKIPNAPATAPDLRLRWNLVALTVSTLGCLRGNRAVLNSVLGISWFWFFGAIFLAQIPNYAAVYLGGDASVAQLVMMVFTVGIGAGSLLCEVLSRRTVEIGLVPLGALGLTVFGVDLYFAQPQAAVVLDLTWRQFLAAEGSWRIVMDLALIGVFGGFYIVPLFALIQQRAPRAQLSRTIAANNILNALFMVAASLLAILFLSSGFSIPELFLLTAVLNALVAIYIFTLVPEFAMRFACWVLIKLFYRLDTRGIEQHIPDEGAALIVCNHVSYVDALLIGGAVPRPIRFVMYYKIFNFPILRWIFKSARAIPIAGSKEDPQLMQRAFEEVDRALADGELIGIFPEGALTKDGEIATFRQGVERILKTRPVPVVPLALTGMWTSMWSKRDSQLRRLRVPRRLRAEVGLMADAALPAAEATAAVLEAKVRALRGDRA